MHFEQANNSQIRTIANTRYLFLTHNLDVSSKTLQCVVMPRIFQAHFLCSYCMTCLEYPSLEEILLFLHSLALMIPFLYILLNHHEKVVPWVPTAQGFKCSYLPPLPCHVRCSATLEAGQTPS